MKYDYLIIHKSVLPDYFEKVIDVKELLQDGEVTTISEAVRRVGISRSAYYKYKDYIFVNKKENHIAKSAIFSLVLNHERGVLSQVLSRFYDLGANVLTIMQNPPINKRAIVVISLDISGVTTDTNNLIQEMELISGVIKAELLDVE